jgi:hypothetical protein
MSGKTLLAGLLAAAGLSLAAAIPAAQADTAQNERNQPKVQVCEKLGRADNGAMPPIDCGCSGGNCSC